MNKQPSALVGDVDVSDDDEEFDTNSVDSGSLIRLMEVLQEIDTTSQFAKINEESIDDNNGGRIVL